MQEKIFLLERIRKELKEEFIGIDYQIDQLITFIKPWFLYQEQQEYPTVINLWGMTGTGKSELVRKLVKKLNYEHLYYSFDLSASYQKEDGTFYYKFDKMSYMYDKTAPIIVFDDIQYAAIRNQYNSSDNSEKSFIWNFIDTGLAKTKEPNYYSDIKEFLILLEIIRDRNIELKDNKIPDIHYLEYYDILKSNDFLQNNKKLNGPDAVNKRKSFIYKRFIELMRKQAPAEFRKLNKKKNYSIKDIYDHLIKYAILSLKPLEYDLKKSLIFMIGNLDKLYTMSFEFEKIPADMLYDITSNITIKNIKDSLLIYFNPEQIARLGHNHIIYHSFKKEHYIDLIKKLLNEIDIIEFKYTNSFVEFLYDTFVFPTQGMRIKKNIKQYVEELIINELIEGQSNNSIKELLFDYNKEKNEILIIKDSKTKIKPYISNSIPIDDNIKYITAIHESAHAVLNIIDTKLIPKYIAIQEKDSDSLGITFTEYPEFQLNKKLLLSKIRCYLAGPISEKLFFGSENISMGTQNDISSATKLAAIIYKHGLNEELIFVQNNVDSEYTYSSIKEQNKEIRKIIRASSEETKLIIKDYELLIESIAEKLFANSILSYNDIKQILKDNSYDNELSEIKSKDNYFNYLPEKFKKEK